MNIKFLMCMMCMLSLIGIASANTYDYSFYNNNYFMATQNITLLLQENQTINITYDAWLSGPSSIYFNSTNTSIHMINVEVPFNFTAGNYTRYVYYNTSLNTTSNISFGFNILQSNQTAFTDLNPTSYTYTYNLSQLPTSFYKRFNITLDVEQDYYVAGDSWISVIPTHFNETNIHGRLYELMPQISIPATAGNFTQTLTITGSSYLKIISFNFNLINDINATIPPTSNMTDQQLMDYLKGLIANQTVYYNNTQYIMNNTNTTNLIEVPTNKEAFLEWYNKIDPNKMEQLESQNNILQNSLLNEKNSKEAAQSDANTALNGMQSINQSMDRFMNGITKALNDYKNEDKKERARIFWGFFSVIAGAGLVGFLIYSANKNDYPL